jgi:glycine/D-amino acid oxidase-like deaminating enzyme
MVDSLHFWEQTPTEDLWWAPHVQDFRQISTLHDPIRSINSRSPADAPKIKYGAASRAISINAPKYLFYLQERARALGVVIFQSRLPTDGGFGKALAYAEGISHAINRGKVDVFVNATGLGAIKLCGDTQMFPIRGQTVLVKGEADATRTRYHDGSFGKGTISYCIVRPGSGTTILGGSMEVGNWSEKPDPEVTARILKRCALLAPELLTGEEGGFEVLSVQCGLRPGRNGGPRVEKEVMGARKIVHAYGHAGGGYQNSIGCADDVLRLVRECVGGVDDLRTSRLKL